MAMDGDRLGNAIKAAIDATPVPTPNSALTEEQVNEYRAALFRAIGNAIISEITTNGTVQGLTVPGVTSGGATSGPNNPGAQLV